MIWLDEYQDIATNKAYNETQFLILNIFVDI